MMRNMPYSSLSPWPAPPNLGVTTRLPIEFLGCFLSFISGLAQPALLLGKSSFSAFNTTQLRAICFCVTCTTGNPVYANGASCLYGDT